MHAPPILRACAHCLLVGGRALRGARGGIGRASEGGARGKNIPGIEN